MEERDIGRIAQTFAGWHKLRSQYERYFAEQSDGRRTVIVALHAGEVVGYVTAVRDSDYAPFREAGIPEIVDLNVIAEHQNRGIGAALIRAAEQAVIDQGKYTSGLSVEQSAAYADAGRLYSKLGYGADGRGITVHDNELHLTRRLQSLDSSALPRP
jgi:GNAT superfamily N-acetyltransferase